MVLGRIEPWLAQSHLLSTSSPIAMRSTSALRVALGKAIGKLVDPEPVASSATGHEHTFASLPFWAESDPPGPFDLVVGTPEAPRIAGEVKWSSTNTLSHTLWEILKLLGVLSLGAEQVYLVAGYPAWVWGTNVFPVIFENGILDFTKLPLGKEWPYLIKNGKGTPTRIPERHRDHRGGTLLIDIRRRAVAASNRRA